MKYKLNEICNISIGRTPPRKEHQWFNNGPDDFKWLSIKDMGQCGKYVSNTSESITREGQKIFNIPVVEPGTLLLSFKLTVGRLCIANDKMLTNEAIAQLPIKNETIVDNDFLYYSLANFKWQTLGSTSSIATAVNSKMIKDIEVDLPDIKIQKKIAAVLNSIDKKIEINNQINRNLSEQAQALYKEMIVDAADETWVPGILSDVADITMGQSPKGDTYNEDGEGTVFYQGRAEFGDRFPTRRLFTTDPKRMAQINDVLLSVRAPVGDLNVAYESCCIGRGLGAIHSNNGHQSYVLYTMIALNPQLDRFNGEGTVFGSINRDALNKMGLSIPPVEVMDSFENVVAPMDAAIRKNYEENCRLISLRDSLLPKLMSGELDVSELNL